MFVTEVLPTANHGVGIVFVYGYYSVASRLCQQCIAMHTQATVGALPETWNVAPPGANNCLCMQSSAISP